MTPTQTLTASQTVALVRLGASMQYRSAVDLGIAPATLGALTRRGLVQMKSHRVQSSNPCQRVSSEPIERSYRMSTAGWRIASPIITANRRAAKASA